MVWRRFFTFPWISLAILAMALGGCSSSTDEQTSSDVFIFARGSDSQKLDPADVDDGESVNAVAQIFEGLVRFKSGTLEIEPALAESYSISEDGLTYRFKLRDGVAFHDGMPLNGETALFSFQRQMDESHPGHLKVASFSYWKYLYQDIVSVEAIGPMELEFKLAKPNASLLSSLAVFPAFLVSPQALDTYGDAMQRNPVGTGPFRFVDWRPNEAIVLERNDDYWGVKPAMQRLIIKVVPDNTVRVLQLKSGDIHAMDGLPPAELPSLLSDDAIDVYQEAGLNVGYLAFNLDSPRMENRDIREAIALAIDRDKLAEVALSGAGRAAHYPVPKGFPGYPEVEQPIPLDLAKARQLIEPHLHLFDTPLEILVMNAPRIYFPEPLTIATFIQGQLKEIGLPVRVVSSDFKAQLHALRNGEFEAGLIGWVGDNGDADNFLSVFFASWAAEKGSATNYSFYRNEEMDRLLLAGRAATSLDQRANVYSQVLEKWRQDLPILPLVHSDDLFAMNSDYEGFEIQKIGELRLAGIRLKSDNARESVDQ